MADVIFTSAKRDLPNGSIDFDTDVIKVMLFVAGDAVNQDAFPKCLMTGWGALNRSPDWTSQAWQTTRAVRLGRHFRLAKGCPRPGWRPRHPDPSNCPPHAIGGSDFTPAQHASPRPLLPSPPSAGAPLFARANKGAGATDGDGRCGRSR